MAIFEYSSILPVSAQEGYRWHMQPGSLSRSVPPWAGVKVIKEDAPPQEGGIADLRVPVGPFMMPWRAKHCDVVEGKSFADEAIGLPFLKWKHQHLVEAVDDAHCKVIDRVQYRFTFDPVSTSIMKPLVEKELLRMFRWRHNRLKIDIQRHNAFSNLPSLHIALAGGSGFLGQQLLSFLTTGGHRVTQFTRDATACSSTNTPMLQWNPPNEAPDFSALSPLDAVIHLGGASIAKRWSAAYQEKIIRSRVESTALLCRQLAKLPHKPKTLLCASAVGFYDNTNEHPATELSPAGQGFLAKVCQEWEAATAPARDAGIRVVNLRLGTVLGPAGGALKQMLTPFRLGLGGIIGNGKQYLSWISSEDAIGAILFLLHTPAIEGAVNLTAPNPATNHTFTKVLAGVLKRPTLLPFPAPTVNLLFGEMGKQLLLGSQYVTPERLLTAGFTFAHPTLETALRHELGMP